MEKMISQVRKTKSLATEVTEEKHGGHREAQQAGCSKADGWPTLLFAFLCKHDEWVLGWWWVPHPLRRARFGFCARSKGWVCRPTNHLRTTQAPRRKEFAPTRYNRSTDGNVNGGPDLSRLSP